MSDIPLSEAQIIWDAEGHPELLPVKVVRLGEKDDARYFSSWGVCNADFANASAQEQLKMLLLKFHQFVMVDEIEPRFVDVAFMAIPEYRAALAEFGTISPEESD